MMSEPRMEDCEICGERYHGESDIRRYLRTIERLDANGEEEAVMICLRHSEVYEEERAMNWDHIYPEIHLPMATRELPVFPETCPACGAEVDEAAEVSPKLGGRGYKCGGAYSWKSQIQNHTRKWWGSCPVVRGRSK